MTKKLGNHEIETSIKKTRRRVWKEAKKRIKKRYLRSEGASLYMHTVSDEFGKIERQLDSAFEESLAVLIGKRTELYNAAAQQISMLPNEADKLGAKYKELVKAADAANKEAPSDSILASAKDNVRRLMEQLKQKSKVDKLPINDTVENHGHIDILQHGRRVS